MEHQECENAAQHKECERKVMICIDGSKHSENAFDFYADNIYKKNDKLICMHVVQIPPPPFPHDQLVTEEWKRILEKKRKRSKFRGKIQNKCENKKLSAKIKVVSGDPVDCICTHACKEKVDLIIAGTRGLGTIRRTILGSVSNDIVHNSDVPTIIVPLKDS